MTTTTVSEMRRRGAGYYVSRVALRGELVAVQRFGVTVAVIVPAERLVAWERAERELASLRAAE